MVRHYPDGRASSWEVPVTVWFGRYLTSTDLIGVDYGADDGSAPVSLIEIDEHGESQLTPIAPHRRWVLHGAVEPTCLASCSNPIAQRAWFVFWNPQANLPSYELISVSSNEGTSFRRSRFHRAWDGTLRDVRVFEAEDGADLLLIGWWSADIGNLRTLSIGDNETNWFTHYALYRMDGTMLCAARVPLPLDGARAGHVAVMFDGEGTTEHGLRLLAGNDTTMRTWRGVARLERKDGVISGLRVDWDH